MTELLHAQTRGCKLVSSLPALNVLDSIASGKQPDGLTTDYLIKKGFPAICSEQRKRFEMLRGKVRKHFPKLIPAESQSETSAVMRPA